MKRLFLGAKQIGCESPKSLWNRIWLGSHHCTTYDVFSLHWEDVTQGCNVLVTFSAIDLRFYHLSLEILMMK